MNESRESISVDVTGANPDELRAAALAHAVGFWGTDDHLRVGDIHARPYLRTADAVLTWEATVDVYRLQRERVPVGDGNFIEGDYR